MKPDSSLVTVLVEASMPPVLDPQAQRSHERLASTGRRVVCCQEADTVHVAYLTAGRRVSTEESLCQPRKEAAGRERQ